MAQSPAWWRILVLSMIVMVIAFSVQASGQNKTGGPALATVDMEKLNKEYKALETFFNELKTMNDKYEARLQRRGGVMVYLTEEDHKQLDTLSEKPLDKQTEADKKTIKEMETKAKQKAEDLQMLSQKAEDKLTEDEKKKLKDANEYLRAAQQRLTLLQEDLKGQITSFNTSKKEELMNKIKAAVQKVAEQKSISIVFDSGVALYAGTDITPQVLGELNKK